MTLLSLLDLPGLSARESAEPGFALALQGVADRLGLDPNFIGAVMSLESGYNPQAVNKQGGATGLIQFMPATATGLGTSAAALKAMTAIQQLPFVEKYYQAAGRAIHKDTPGDYYMATFLPAYVGKPAEFVIAERGMPIYDQNAGLDADHDGTLTVGDVWAKIDGAVAAARARPMLSIDTDTEKKSSSLPAPRAPSLPSPSLASPVPSSGPPFGSSPERGASMTRELVVFAASCELEDLALFTSQHNAAGVESRVLVYWNDVLRAAKTRELGAHDCPPEWCGAFALWCLHQAGVGLELFWEFGPPHFGFLWNLRTTTTPQPGDIAYLDKPFEHHAIVVTVEGDNVHTIDGNQGAAAPIKTREVPLSHWTAFYSIAPLLEVEPPTGVA